MQKALLPRRPPPPGSTQEARPSQNSPEGRGHWASLREETQAPRPASSSHGLTQNAAGPGRARLPVRLQRPRGQLEAGAPREVLPVARLVVAGLLGWSTYVHNGAILGPDRVAEGGRGARGHTRAVSTAQSLGTASNSLSSRPPCERGCPGGGCTFVSDGKGSVQGGAGGCGRAVAPERSGAGEVPAGGAPHRLAGRQHVPQQLHAWPAPERSGSRGSDRSVRPTLVTAAKGRGPAQWPLTDGRQAKYVTSLRRGL